VRIGPLTLEVLLKAGADPNCKSASGSPLARILDADPALLSSQYKLRMVLLLVAAGADVTDITPGPRLAEPFAQVCSLRSLCAFCSDAKPSGDSSPAVHFVAHDGDSAIAHRVRAFLISSDVFTLN
jgi:hypothetical protein